MTVRDAARVALRALAATPLRSLLTALGVIIGVGAVVAMVAIGQGARRNVEQQVQALGSNLLTVFAGTQRLGGVARDAPVQTLTVEDAEAILREVPGVVGVSPEYTARAQVTAGAANTTTSVSGVLPAFEAVRNFRVARGAFITDDDVRTRARVAVLGQTVATALFGDDDPLGRRIRIRGVTFTVVGVMEPKGATAFVDRDDVIFVPLSTAQRRLFGVTHVRTIQVQMADRAAMDAGREALAALLRARHRLGPADEDDFTIRSQADLLQTLGGVSQTMTMLLGGIATVSLVVGGIGIMNIMLVSVSERTREIGIRKAVGARRRDVLLQFLVEAVALSVGGGLIGLAVGALGSALIGRVAGWPTLLSVPAMLLAFSFAVAVGIGFGLYPAQRAAAMDPIAALRHE
mgnify:CR=1 FL=1